MDILKMVLDFACHCKGGESYWIDFEGNRHSADMGYVCEYLEDLLRYIDSIGGVEEFRRRWEREEVKEW